MTVSEAVMIEATTAYVIGPDIFQCVEGATLGLTPSLHAATQLGVSSLLRHVVIRLTGRWNRNFLFLYPHQRISLRGTTTTTILTEVSVRQATTYEEPRTCTSSDLSF